MIKDQDIWSVDFNRKGTLLASAPDYMLTLWEWRHEQAMLCCKAFVLTGRLRVTFSPDNAGQLTTSGSGHMKSVAINQSKCFCVLALLYICQKVLYRTPNPPKRKPISS